MYRKNWTDRWDQLTGNRPDKKLLKAPSWSVRNTMRQDALKPESRKFIRGGVK